MDGADICEFFSVDQCAAITGSTIVLTKSLGEAEYINPLPGDFGKGAMRVIPLIIAQPDPLLLG